MRSGHSTHAWWLLMVSLLVVFMIGLGAYVRLSRAGLSIVEWNVVMGVIPPRTEAEWEVEFAKYKQSPEYQKVNRGMSLEEYKEIFYIEWFHRLIGRFVGLLVIVPFVYWWIRGRLTPTDLRRYGLVVVLFLSQGVMGWLMVKSGLQDRPAVSHYRLALHLMFAIVLLALTWRYWLEKVVPRPPRFRAPDRYYVAFRWFMVLFISQLVYGAFMAGLKAGYFSDTFPLMSGSWVPPGLLTTFSPAWLNVVENPATVHFIHRWLAFVVLIAFGWVYWLLFRCCRGTAVLRWAHGVFALINVQITLGILTILYHVPKWLAIVHQLTAVLIFMALLVMAHYHRPTEATASNA